MPRRYNKKKRPYYKYTKRSMDVASKALSMALMTKKLLNVEHKHIDTGIAAGQVLASFIQPITNCIQGTTAQTRDGAQIKVTSLYWRYGFHLPAGSTQPTYVRCMIVKDKQTNGSIYFTSDILADSSTPARQVFSPLKLDNKFRFRVLYDKVHKICPNSNQAITYNDVYKKLELKLRYDGNTGLISDLASDSLSLLIISDQNGAGTSPFMESVMRVRYVDN